MLRTNPGFWFLCAVLQGNSPPAFSLVFFFHFFFFFFSISTLFLYHSLSFSRYIHIHVHMFIYFIHYTTEYISRCTCVIFADMIKQPSLRLSFYSLLSFHCSIFHTVCLSSYPLSCASFSRVATFSRSPSIYSI